LAWLPLKYLEEACKKLWYSCPGWDLVRGKPCKYPSFFKKSGYTRCAHMKNIGEKFGKILDVVIYQKEI